MIKQQNSQVKKLILCVFIYLVLGYGFAHYLALVSWLCNKASGAGYYEYYVNGIRTSGGSTLAGFLFLLLGILIPIGVFELIIRKIDKTMATNRKPVGEAETCSSI